MEFNLIGLAAGIATFLVVWIGHILVRKKEQAVRAELGWFPFREQKIQPPFADVIKKLKAPHL